MMTSLKTLLLFTSGLMETWCFKIYRRIYEEGVYFVFRIRNESKNMVHLCSHHKSNEVWEFRSSRGPTKEVRVLHLAKNLRQVFIFFVVFQQNSLLCRGDDQLCCKLYISNTVQLFHCSLSHSNKIWTHNHFVTEHWTIYSNWPTGLETNWLWVEISLMSLTYQISHLFSASSSLTFRQL